MKAANPNCDGSHCSFSKSEVRVLPYGGGGNLILCHACYCYEMVFRRSRNKELSSAAAFDLPTWDSLEVYALEES